MPKTPGQMHMYDMVKIDTIVFEIVWGAFIIHITLKMPLDNFGLKLEKSEAVNQM